MGDARAVLTLMNADGEITQRRLPPVGEETIQLVNNRFAPFHAEESQVDTGQLARFYATGLRVILEPFVQGVAIKPASAEEITDSTDGRWLVPPSVLDGSSHHYVHLRPDDVAYFENHNLQICYSLQQPSKAYASAEMPPAISDQDEGVQVRSSDPQRLQKGVQGTGASDSDTEDDGDLDGTNNPVTATPVISRPTATNEIKETPHQGAEDEEAPFSTALDQREEDKTDGTSQAKERASSEIVAPGDLDSPSARAGIQREARTGRSQDTNSASRIQFFSQEDFETFPSSPVRAKKHYGGRSRRNTPQKDSDISAGNAPLAENQTTDLPAQPTTSQTLYPNGRAYEVAQRSLSNKRKLASNTAEGDEPPSKSRKVTPDDEPLGGQDSVRIRAAELTEDGELATEQQAEEVGDAEKMDEAKADDQQDASESDDDDDNDGPLQVPAEPRVSSGRLPRVATQDSGSDVIVAKPRETNTRPKSSPEIVVRPQRTSKSASKTPAGTPRTPDSTANSSLPGKPPKIITSTVTGKYNGSSALAKFTKAQGCTIITAVPTRRTNFLCMVKDDEKLMKTPKVLRSLALGKQIVTERWIAESKAAGELLDPAGFVHPEVADTIDTDRRKLFSSMVLFFTNAAVNEYGVEGWQEMKALAEETGATTVDSGTGAKGGKMTGRNSVLYIGTNDDADATTLIEDYSRVVYHKDIIKESVVSAGLDLDDESHKLKAGKTKKGRR